FAQRPARRAWNLERKTKVAMAGCLRNHRTRRIDARTLDGALIYRALESEYRAAHVAHRCKATHQRRFSLARGQYMEVRVIGSHEQWRGCCRHERMPMRVNESRHQDAAISGDDLDIDIWLDGDRIHGNSIDGVALDKNIGRRRHRCAFAIKDAHLLKEGCAGTSRRDRRGRAWRCQKIVLAQTVMAK